MRCDCGRPVRHLGCLGILWGQPPRCDLDRNLTGCLWMGLMSMIANATATIEAQLVLIFSHRVATSLEPLQLSDQLLDPGAYFVKSPRHRSMWDLAGRPIRNDPHDPMRTGRVTVGQGVIALVCDDPARGYLGSSTAAWRLVAELRCETQFILVLLRGERCDHRRC
jgi:hypothetical protein